MEERWCDKVVCVKDGVVKDGLWTVCERWCVCQSCGVKDGV